MAAKTWNPAEFWSGQDLQTSARLHLQHWVWNYQLGYTLHPKIPNIARGSIRIADVAAGNGAWILDVNRTLASGKTQFDGFDITSSNFPDPAWLPGNIKLHVWDAFSNVPPEYMGVFDIVHIRAFYSCIVDNDVKPVLNNLIKMLKPGGYLQWDESDFSTLSCQVPSADSKADAAQTIVKIQNMFARAQSKLIPDWIYKLPETLKHNGCEMITHDEFQPSKELARAWNDNLLLVWRDTIPMIPEKAMPLPPGMGLPESISRDSYAELFRQAVDECSKGARLGMVYHVFVARKAT